MRRGRRKLVVPAVGAAGIFTLGLGLSLASGAATGTARWPGPLHLVQQYPWPATSVLALISAACAVVARVRSQRTAERRALRPGGVEQAPSWVVDRAETARAIAAVLHAGSGRTVGITTAVLGAGGFGKTTVAQLVCADRRVRRRFGNRVYLVTVGRPARSRSQIALKVAEATRQITGEDGQLPEPQAAGALLGSLLAEAREPVLLVLDDVWESGQLAPFLIGAPNCVRLVTTRVKDVLPENAACVLVDRLPAPQALQVLTRDLPPRDLVNLAAPLIDVCGGWALLLRLANRWIHEQLRTDDDIARHIRRLRELLRRGPAELDRPGAVVDLDDPRERNLLVDASVKAALGLLPTEVAHHFAELGAFPQDEAIPIRVLSRLWSRIAGLDEDASRRVCLDLERLSLIGLDPADGGSVTTHDVLHDYARGLLGPRRTRETNQELITAIEEGLPPAEVIADSASGIDRAWWELGEETEGYLLEHAIEHLQAAGYADRAAALAADLRWVGARLMHRGPTGPINDLSRIPGTDTTERAADLVRIAHLLAPLDPAHGLIDTLHSYLQPLPRWSGQADALVRLGGDRHSRLVNAWPPPDLPNAVLQRVLTSQVAGIYALAISPDGTWLASDCDDDKGAILIWDRVTGTTVMTLTGHTKEVQTLAISPDGTWLASGGDDTTIRLWDRATGRTTAILKGHIKEVSAVAICPDGSLLASGSADKTVRVWDRATGHCIMTLSGHDDDVTAIAISPDGTLLASGDGDGIVRVWGISSGVALTTLQDPSGEVSGLSFSPDGKLLATCGGDEVLRIWDRASGSLAKTLNGHEDRVQCVAMSPDGTWLATGSSDRSVRTWDAASENTAIFTDHTGPVTAVAISADSTWLASASRDWTIRLRNRPSGPVGEPFIPYADDIECGAISPDGKWLAMGGYDALIRMLDLHTNHVIATLTGNRNPIRTLAFSPDGMRLASGSSDLSVQIWDLAAMKRAATLVGHSESVNSLSFSPDGRWLASGSGDETVRIWDLATMRCAATLTDHEEAVSSVAMSPDGSWLASSDVSGVVRVWEKPFGQSMPVFDFARRISRPHPFTAVSPDGSLLAVIEGERVHLWDHATRQVVAVLSSGSARVGTLVFSPDSSWLATFDESHVVRVWSTTTHQCATAVRTDAILAAVGWADEITVVGHQGAYGYHFVSGRTR